MGRACGAVLIVAAAGVFVWDDYAQRCARSPAAENAAEYLETVALAPCRVGQTRGTAAGEQPLYIFIFYGEAGGKAVDYGAYRRAVALAEERYANAAAE